MRSGIKLSVIEMDGTEDRKRCLYLLYHTMINPSVYMDVDGMYRGIDHNLHQAEDFTNYTVFLFGIPIEHYILCLT